MNQTKREKAYQNQFIENSAVSCLQVFYNSSRLREFHHRSNHVQTVLKKLPEYQSPAHKPDEEHFVRVDRAMIQ